MVLNDASTSKSTIRRHQRLTCICEGRLLILHPIYIVNCERDYCPEKIHLIRFFSFRFVFLISNCEMFVEIGFPKQNLPTFHAHKEFFPDHRSLIKNKINGGDKRCKLHSKRLVDKKLRNFTMLTTVVFVLCLKFAYFFSNRKSNVMVLL